MKIKRFFAADIRQAMRMVKEELGADAVIMSNRTVDGGIEIVAAQDFDEQSIQNTLKEQTAGKKPEPQKTPAAAAAAPNGKKSVLPNFDAAKKRLQLLNSQRKQDPEATAPAPEQPTRRPVDQYVGYAEKIQLRGMPETAAPKAAVAAVAPVVREDPLKHLKTPEKPAGLSEQLLMEMSKELKYLRTTMDTKLANISWAHPSQATPVRIDLLRRLTGMSLSKKLSVMIADHFVNHTDAGQVFTKAQEMLVKVLPMANDGLLETGGIVALVGPTGVGKTTTIAKLAAQFILKHGAGQVALITTDNYRIAAHEQLNTYGRILDVPVRVASSPQELRQLIHGFANRRLILIDTAGMGQRDMKLVEQINTLQQNELSIRSYLVMSAATEYKAMKAIIKAFSVFNPQAGILTKLDEAMTIGPALSAVIENNLPMAFITDGQQVPEDLHGAHARSLVEQCVAELEAESDFNDDVDFEPWMAQGYA
jgi:flagellar biosynthesis protein FlhF